jgi:hypothetical protein
MLSTSLQEKVDIFSRRVKNFIFNCFQIPFLYLSLSNHNKIYSQPHSLNAQNTQILRPNLPIYSSWCCPISMPKHSFKINLKNYENLYDSISGATDWFSQLRHEKKKPEIWGIGVEFELCPSNVFAFYICSNLVLYFFRSFRFYS